MSDEAEKTIDQIKAWLLPGAGALLGILLNIQVNSATSKIDNVVAQMQEQITASKVQTAQFIFLTERVNNLESAKKDAENTHNVIGQRLNSLEQRSAIHDGFMEENKNK